MEDYEKHWSGDKPRGHLRGDLMVLIVAGLAGAGLAWMSGLVVRLITGGAL